VPIATEIVVFTAGVWLVDVARMIGLELPVRGETIHSVFAPEGRLSVAGAREALLSDCDG
jgi:glycine/D-amino acid oxidase-like deaminating enzyme